MSWLRRKARARSGWVLEQARSDIRRQRAIKSRLREMVTWSWRFWQKYPFWSSWLLQALIVGAAWVAGHVTAKWFADPALHPSAITIATAWPVVATFTAIAFAGLTVIIQVTATPVVTSRSATQALFEKAQFQSVLALSITTCVQVGFAGVFLDHPGSVVIEVGAVSFVIVWIGLAYAKIGRIFSQPGAALRLGQELLERDLRQSLRDIHARSEAEARLQQLVPRDWVGNYSKEDSTHQLVTADSEVVFSDVHVGILKKALKEISQTASPVSVATDAPQQVQIEEKTQAPQLLVTASLGATVQPNQPIFVLIEANLSKAAVGKLTGMLTEAVRVDELGVPQTQFEDALTGMRDNIVKAIADRALGTVKEGLQVYRHLIRVYFDEQTELQKVLAVDGEVQLGREWHVLLRGLHEIIDTISASRSLRIWIDSLSWVTTLARDCWDTSAPDALTTILGLLENLWRQELLSPSTDAESRQDSLLLNLADFGMLCRFDQSENLEIKLALETAYGRSFLNIIKQAVDANDAELSKLAIEYFKRGFGVDISRQDDSPTADSVLLLVYAWILYRLDYRQQSAEFRTVLTEIASTLGKRPHYDSILRSTQRSMRAFQTHWWEAGGRGPIRAGGVQIDSYVQLAFILVAPRRVRLLSLDPNVAADVTTAYKLLEILEGIEQGGFAKAVAATGVDAEAFAHLKERLQAVISEANRSREESYARLPLSPDRLATFHSAVTEKLIDARAESLAGVLCAGSDADAASPVAKFGINSVVPRWYFAETDVYADPADLADNFVRSLVLGEQRRILDLVVGDASEAEKIVVEKLPESIETELDSATAKIVIVTNSFHAFQQLTHRPADLPVWVAKCQYGDADVIRIYDDREPFVALMVAGETPRVHLRTPDVEGPDDQQLDDVGVIVGVRELTDAEIDNLLAEKERSALEKEQLLGSVSVRILEHFEVSMDASVKPRVWRLPEDTW